jgi:hypothetical protein
LELPKKNRLDDELIVVEPFDGRSTGVGANAAASAVVDANSDSNKDLIVTGLGFQNQCRLCVDSGCNRMQCKQNGNWVNTRFCNEMHAMQLKKATRFLLKSGAPGVVSRVGFSSWKVHKIFFL